MSLVGNLEDLSLPDILQIISLSRKSGILTIEQEGLQGKIFIREGRIIQTVSPRSGGTLGEILSAGGLVGPEDLKRALEIQRSGEEKELLGGILVRLGLIGEEALERIIRQQIGESIVSFLSWREGTFGFELADIRGRGEVSIDPHAFILEKGIDTQWLVLEGTRILDDRTREGEKSAGGAAEEIGGEPPKESAPEGRRGIVIVDDDPVFRERLRERLAPLGRPVVACEGTEEGIRAVGELPRNLPPVVVTDIVYTTSDGRGFLGGLELIEKLRDTRPEVAVVAVTAYPDEKVRARAAELGVSRFLVKPSGTGEGGEEEWNAFFEGLVSALSQALEGETVAGETGAEGPDRPPPPHSTEEKKTAPSEEEAPLAVAGLDRDEMTLLRDMMRELQGPRASSEIGLLILRFAAELLNRAVLFIVKGDRAVGLGGFGVEVPGEERKGGVRGISIPLGEPSLLREVVDSRAASRGPIPESAWNARLLEGLGGQKPREAVALPLLVSGKVRVILYGDNLPGELPLPRTQSLEIFLAQAGLTLERVLLEKKVQEADSPSKRTGVE
jgi:DNA-binding NarL/FixJ family response regulator